jgi:hypothetical protein
MKPVESEFFAFLFHLTIDIATALLKDVSRFRRSAKSMCAMVRALMDAAITCRPLRGSISSFQKLSAPGFVVWLELLPVPLTCSNMAFGASL